MLTLRVLTRTTERLSVQLLEVADGREVSVGDAQPSRVAGESESWRAIRAACVVEEDPV